MQSATDKPATPERLMQMTWAYSAPLIIEAAIRNRLFDLLDKGPKTVEELSRESGASIRGLRMIANALVSFELLRRNANRYALTPESQTFLVSTKPSYQGGIFKHVST